MLQDSGGTMEMSNKLQQQQYSSFFFPHLSLFLACVFTLELAIIQKKKKKSNSEVRVCESRTTKLTDDSREIDEGWSKGG